jgi:hypothetical protein
MSAPSNGHDKTKQSAGRFPAQHQGVDAIGMLDTLASTSHTSHAARAQILRDAAADLEQQVRCHCVSHATLWLPVKRPLGAHIQNDATPGTALDHQLVV